MPEQVRPAASQARHVMQYDGKTIVIAPPSTLYPGPRIAWWHEEDCAIDTAKQCTCSTTERLRP